MQKSRVNVAFRKVFDRKPDFEKRSDLITATALTWTLGCMDVNFSNDELFFDIEYGYLFSKQLKINIDEKQNLSHEHFSQEDLDKIQIVRDSLAPYKSETLKMQVLQASACYSCLRTIAGEYSVKNEFNILCPRYDQIKKQAFLNYNYIQKAYKNLEDQQTSSTNQELNKQ